MLTNQRPVLPGHSAAQPPVPDAGGVVLSPGGHEALTGVQVDVESAGRAGEALVTRVGHIEKPEHLRVES